MAYQKLLQMVSTALELHATGKKQSIQSKPDTLLVLKLRRSLNTICGEMAHIDLDAAIALESCTASGGWGVISDKTETTLQRMAEILGGNAVECTPS